MEQKIKRKEKNSEFKIIFNFITPILVFCLICTLLIEYGHYIPEFLNYLLIVIVDLVNTLPHFLQSFFHVLGYVCFAALFIFLFLISVILTSSL
ncbi:hypothetical protein [Viridibacillus arvi]|uniref:hypothetical protein n=1 Tax=Viridibacillus arvi TaxID=263475 RepID=UPI0034CF3E66